MRILLIISMLVIVSALAGLSISGSLNSGDDQTHAFIIVYRLPEYMPVYEDEQFGDYEITLNQYGTYIVSAHSHFQGIDLYYDNVFNIEEATPIQLSMNNPNVTGIDFDFMIIQGNSTLTGTVTNQQNEPVNAVWVSLLAQGQGSHGFFNETFTDETGHYEIPSISEGNYILRLITFPGQHPYFYENAANPQDATIIHFEDNEEQVIDVQLVPPEMHFISGTVRNAQNNEPLEGAIVSVFPDFGSMPYDYNEGCDHNGNIEPLFHEYSAITDANGFYHFEVPEMELYALAWYEEGENTAFQLYDHTDNPEEATLILLDHDIDNIDFSLFEEDNYPHWITGNIVVDDVSPEFPIYVVAVSSDEDWDETEIALNGYYSVNVQSGRYYLYIYSEYFPPYYYPGVYEFENAVPIEIMNDNAVIDLSVTSANSFGYFSQTGVVDGPGKSPIDNATVIFRNEYGYVESFCYTDVTGNFEADWLIPQEYTVTATKPFYYSDTQQIVTDGNESLSFVLNEFTSIDESNDEVPKIEKAGNFPNPFNPSTNIFFSLDTDYQHVTVDIYNLKGRKIRSLLNDILDKGNHTVVWDGCDYSGETVSSGIYFLRISTPDFETSKRMILLK